MWGTDYSYADEEMKIPILPSPWYPFAPCLVITVARGRVARARVVNQALSRDGNGSAGAKPSIAMPDEA